jgi:hypothetical protein
MLLFDWFFDLHVLKVGQQSLVTSVENRLDKLSVHAHTRWWCYLVSLCVESKA